MDDYTIVRCSKLIKSSLLYFMQNGSIKDHQKLMDSLNSLMFCMANKYNLTNEDKRFILYLFWEEYNQGCSPQMSPQYINAKLIPTIFKQGKIDIPLGSSVLLTLENSIR